MPKLPGLVPKLSFIVGPDLAEVVEQAIGDHHVALRGVQSIDARCGYRDFETVLGESALVGMVVG